MHFVHFVPGPKKMLQLSTHAFLSSFLSFSNGGQAVKCTCTHCGESVSQDRNPEGQNYCIQCGNLFLVPPETQVPTWVWGVVAVLLANWQILRTAI